MNFFLRSTPILFIISNNNKNNADMDGLSTEMTLY